MHFLTILIEFRLLTPAIFKTMQMNFYAELMQSFYFIKQIEYAAIISRVRHVKTNDMKTSGFYNKRIIQLANQLIEYKTQFILFNICK